MAERLASLSEYLAIAGRRPWEWGQFDCLLFGADWIIECIGRDPAIVYRGAYDDVRSARRLLKGHGGIESFTNKALASVGILPTQVPKAGDFGLVLAQSWYNVKRIALLPTGAICVGENMWAVKPYSYHGIDVQRFRLIRAWGVG